jgi:hypothetical protein
MLSEAAGIYLRRLVAQKLGKDPELLQDATKAR